MKLILLTIKIKRTGNCNYNCTMVILQVLLLYSIEVGMLGLVLCSLSGGGELSGAEIMGVISWSGARGGVGGRGTLH